ncbi:PD40 domain-containing protein [Blastococcus sp. TF02A-26]|uniref:S9 family peptidase n=1 Tax=Blastococcus sp. TF02A-26 TaxID=2250577 RepID=UPI000DE844AF|nr:PD40 domain-containing protein [Blastococcus sp. TF02A-26]RBY90657.1 hypothetical protein DQ240_00830 [Blastococcus sp. TF02A-26]
MRPDDLALLRTPGTPAVAPDGRIAVVAVTRPDVAGNGYRSQLWAVPTDASAPARPLTSGGRDSDPAFSPDGRWLAYLAALGDGAPQVHVLPTAGGAPRRLTDAPLGAGAPVWSPDSRRLAWAAVPGGAPEPDAPRLITPRRPRPDDLGPLADRPLRVHVLDLPDLLADDDAPVPVPVLVGDADPDPVALWRSRDGELVRVARGGAVELRRALSNADPEVLVDGPFTVHGAACGGGVVVASVGHDGSAGELIAITPGRRRLLTAFGSALAATGRVHRATAVGASAPDGTPVDGRITVPAGPGPHPVLVLVPDDRPGWSLQEDVQVAATAGVAVVQCDRAEPEAVLALLDAAVDDPRLDADRIGVAGGAAAVELLGRSERFAAAVVEFGRVDEPPAGAVPVPTLVLHGEQDLRGPGVALHAALERRGVPAELLLFPRGGAEVARTGRPADRVARLEHLVRWWRRWLTPAAVVD